MEITQLSGSSHKNISGKLVIIGITTRESFYEDILGYSYISKESLNVSEIDFVIAMANGKTLLSIEKDAMQVGFEYGQIIPVKAMSLIGFDFEKYQQIKLNPPTIFCPNCWGDYI